MCVPTHLVVKGTDVQCRISWCVLRTHVCTIEEKVLQMLDMSIPASLWRDTLISLLLYNLAVSGKHSMQTYFFLLFNQRIYYFNLDLIFKTTPGLNGKPTNQICISVYELRCVHFRHSKSVQKFKHMLKYLANSNVNY